MQPVLSIALIVLLSNACAVQWTIEPAVTTARLRGLVVVSAQVAWASGTSGTFVRTDDGGRTWKVGQVVGAEELDFRDVHAFDARNAFLLSIGEGQKSRIYQTADGGTTWALRFQEPRPKSLSRRDCLLGPRSRNRARRSRGRTFHHSL